MASINDKFRKSYSLLTKSLSSSIDNATTTIPLNNVTNVPTDTAVDCIIDRVDSNGNRTPSAREIVKGVVSGSNLINCVRGVHGTTAQSHSSGAVVEFTVSAAAQNDQVDGILQDHNQSGYHKDLTDANGNLWLKQTATGSAVNYLTNANAATGNGPTLSATGTDTNIDFNIAAKGTGVVKTSSNLDMNSKSIINFNGWSPMSQTVSSVTCNGNRSYDITFNSTVASYLTPGMRLRTTRTVAAPTGAISLNGTTQYANKTSPSGMTFTDDFVVSAWIKLTAYNTGSNQVIASRYNGTSGWEFSIGTAGQIVLIGYNAGSSNVSYVQSYQSVPLNKWVHVAAQLDMSSFTATTTTSYVMFDGVDVPASVLRGGTNPTSLINNVGNLEIGSRNGGTAPFTGNIAQVAIYNAKVTQANVRATISQSLTGSETSLISAYKLDQASGLTDLNTGNANNLTAQGSPTYSTASPFTTDATGTPGGTYDYAIVQKVATTVATVQVPEGNTIPTTGGVSAVDLSAWKAPFGMPVQRNKWVVELYDKAGDSSVSYSNSTWTNIHSSKITIPVGEWQIKYSVHFLMAGAAGAILAVTLSTANNSESDTRWTTAFQVRDVASTGGGQHIADDDLALSSATAYYLNGNQASGGAKNMSTNSTPMKIQAIPSYL